MRTPRSVLSVILFLIMMLLPVFAFAGVEEVINKQYPLEGDGEVYLQNISGNISVSTWNKDKIRIKATKKAHSEKDLDKINVMIDSEDDHIRIKTEYDKSFHSSPFSIFSNNNWSVTYELTVPEKAEVSLESVSGGIRVAGVQNDVKCKSVSGNIDLEGITGDASVEVVSGGISIDKITGEITAKTVSGNIRIDTGSVVESIKGNTVSGGIRVKGILSPGGDYDLSTVSGNIKFMLPADSEFDLRAKTFSGGINSDFSITLSGGIDHKNLNGVVGKGGPEISLSTFSGSIRLVKD